MIIINYEVKTLHKYTIIFNYEVAPYTNIWLS